MELEKRLDNGKLLQFISPALVFDSLDDDINIGLSILKQLNVNISLSNDYPITLTIDSGKKQSVVKMNEKSQPKFITDEEYHDSNSYPSIP